MPYIQNSAYSAPFYLPGGHLQTIVPNLVRSVPGIHYERERIHLPDGDFMDLDWSFSESENLIVLIHGLEGNSEREYMKGMVRFFNQKNWNACAVNLRGCSGEPNLVLQTYHSGKTEDVESIVTHIGQNYSFKRVVLCGFSLGGNLVLKYGGEQGTKMPSFIKNICAYSTPVDLADACAEMEKWYNWIYVNRFLDTLIDKIQQKKDQGFDVDMEKVRKAKTLIDIDNYATAKLNGFIDAADYYAKCSSLPQLHNIAVPSLLVNALNDPFLGDNCYPIELSKKLPIFHFEAPNDGGHVGFPGYGQDFFPEQRTYEFIKQFT